MSCPRSTWHQAMRDLRLEVGNLNWARKQGAAIVRLWQGRHDGKRIVMTTERVEINPAIMMGKPVIRGTRITVELIPRKLAEGANEGELLEDYPHLTTDDIRAAAAYGAASVAHEEVVLLSNVPIPGKC